MYGNCCDSYGGKYAPAASLSGVEWDICSCGALSSSPTGTRLIMADNTFDPHCPRRRELALLTNITDASVVESIHNGSTRLVESMEVDSTQVESRVDTSIN